MTPMIDLVTLTPYDVALLMVIKQDEQIKQLVTALQAAIDERSGWGSLAEKAIKSARGEEPCLELLVTGLFIQKEN